MQKFKVGSVSYLNTRPLNSGLRSLAGQGLLEFTEDHPARIASMLLQDRINTGLVPAILMNEDRSLHLVSDFCISCDGPVGSVVICSEVPLEDVEDLILDYESLTSVQLARILLQRFWNVAPQFLRGFPGYENKLSGSTAGLLIGDRALKTRNRFRYQYDLGQAWKEFTNHPFVFAVWLSKNQLPESFKVIFGEAQETGLQRIDEIIAAQQPSYPNIDVAHYLRQNIQYKLNADKERGLSLFLEMATSLQTISV